MKMIKLLLLFLLLAGISFQANADEKERIPKVSALMPYEYGYSSLYFHMNWGWGGNYDGWFNYDTDQPAEGESNYEHNRENLYIYPRH